MSRLSLVVVNTWPCGDTPPLSKIKISKIGHRHVLSSPKLGLEPKFHDPGTFGGFGKRGQTDRQTDRQNHRLVCCVVIIMIDWSFDWGVNVWLCYSRVSQNTSYLNVEVVDKLSFVEIVGGYPHRHKGNYLWHRIIEGELELKTIF